MPAVDVAPRAPARAVAAEGAARASATRCARLGRLWQRGLRAAVAKAVATHRDKRITLWFMDEARLGQKGRTGHRWWVRDQRPPGLADKRFASAYLFAAVEPATGRDACLVLPHVSTAAMTTFLAAFADALRPNEHAVLVLDQAAWHGARDLIVPACITLVSLPPYCPELNPAERVWLHRCSTSP